MALIESPRHSRADLEHWRQLERLDAVYSRRCQRRLDRLCERAIDDLRTFFAAGLGYVGVSWGKDSVVLADLAALAGIDAPLVWVRVTGVENPDCPIVRDAYLLQATVRYEEIEAPPGRRRTSAPGFAIAADRFGDRYASGVRAEESKERALRVYSGIDTPRALAPLGHWTAADIFAWLYRQDLPIHPAYGCTFGGAIDRGRVRVGALGGDRGTGRGRREWERHYYGDRWG